MPALAFTCSVCGEEMTYNVPRLGPNGGFIHQRTGSFHCGPAPIREVIAYRAPRNFLDRAGPEKKGT